MPRPWDEDKLKMSNFDFEKKWGPETAKDGTTREEFFEKMAAMGWNLPGDENVLRAMYVHAADHIERYQPSNPNILKDLMTRNVANAENPYEEKRKICNEVHALNVSINYPGQAPLQFYAEKFVYARELYDNGWNRPEDVKFINLFLKYTSSDHHYDYADVTFKKQILHQDPKTDYGRKGALQDLRRACDSKFEPEELQIVEEEEKRIAEADKKRADEEFKQKDRVLRSYMYKVADNDLDSMDVSDTGRREWAGEERFKDLEPDSKKLDAVNAAIDKLNISEELLEGKDVNEIANALQEEFTKIIKDNYDAEAPEELTDLSNNDYSWEFGEHLDSPAVLKQYLKDTFARVAKDRLVAKAAEQDEIDHPEVYERAKKIDKAIIKIRAIVRLFNIEANKKFREAVKSGKNREETDLMTISVDRGIMWFLGQKYDFNQDSAAQQREVMAILDEIKKQGIVSLEDLKSAEQLENPFWDNYTAPLTDKEVEALQNKLTNLSEKGLNWDEYVNSGVYKQFLDEHNIQMGGDFDPVEIAKNCNAGPAAVEKVKKTVSKFSYDQAMECMNLIEQEFDQLENKADMSYVKSAFDLSKWFNRNGYDMAENSLLVVNGFDEVKINGETFKTIKFGEEISEEKLDRDKLDSDAYKGLIDKAKEARQLYVENEKEFSLIFAVMRNYEDGWNDYSIQTFRKMEKITENKELMDKANKFRHALYEIKAADERVCKLVNVKEHNKPVLVDPLSADTVFDTWTVAREKGVLDTAYEMVLDPTNRTKRDSAEYKKVMASILKAKDILSQNYPNNETARRAYVKQINTILHNISEYRNHKAKDGIKQDATEEKLIALERVDKLLRTRYQSLEQREYEDNLSGLSELFEIKIDEEKFGDQYLLDKAKQKIENMKKTFADYQRQLEGEAPIKRSNSFSGKPVDIKDEPEEEKKIEEPKPELEEKIEEPKPELEEKIEEPKPEIEKKEEEPKLEEKIEEPKKDKVDMKALSENEMFKAAQKVEDDYRKTLDPKDDFGREKLIGSAEKTLYLATVLHGCGVQAKTQEDAESLLEKGMRDFGKANSVSFRRYKFEFLTDKDFNKEFQERVIKGAEEGKISHDDILTYRDEALKACFTKYKGKDTKALNNLSNKIGSKVNSDNAKVEAKPKVHVMQ